MYIETTQIYIVNLFNNQLKFNININWRKIKKYFALFNLSLNIIKQIQ